jgi:predicted CoA-binding protein
VDGERSYPNMARVPKPTDIVDVFRNPTYLDEVVDELQIHQIPVLFARGRRLFDELPSRIELEIVRVIDTPEATHIRCRVRR